ncbi:MAG: thioredoxin family protein [Thiohalorhabdus sp.]
MSGHGWLGAGLALLLGVLLAAAPAAAPGQGEAPARVDWEAAGWLDDLSAAQKRARQAGKPVFVYFDAEWCSWCHRYEAETLSEPRVQRALRAATVPVRLDWDARRDLVQRFGGRGLPFNVLLAPDGRVLRTFTGILPPAELIALVRDIPEAAPAPEESAITPSGLGRPDYEAFRGAFLEHVERLYAPDVGTLAGRYETGTGLKRTQPRTWMWLAGRPGWAERAREARTAEVERLLDPLDGGFFYYVDPHRPEAHRETAKLLEHNAWMVAWLAGSDRQRVRNAAWSGWFFLRITLWDAENGGFWRARIADADYYARPASERLARRAPPVDRAKLADANAQAALALLRAGRRLEDPTLAEHARGALDFVLEELLHEGRLYHSLRDGERVVADLPEDLFWVLIAGDAVQEQATEAGRAERLEAVAGLTARWLDERMEEGGGVPSGETAALAARACGLRERYPQLPEGCREWALERLALGPETRPDWLIPGLRAWEERAGPTDRR